VGPQGGSVKILDATLPGIEAESLETIHARELARKRETQAAAARERARIAREDKAASRHPSAMTFGDVESPTFFDL